MKIRTLIWRGFALGLLLPLTGCVLGNVRQVKVDALGPYEEARGVTVEVTGEAPDAVKEKLRESFQREVDARAHPPAGAGGDPLRLLLHIEEAREPQDAASTDTTRIRDQVRTAFGFTGLEGEGGRLAIEGILLAPQGEERLGLVRWESAGNPEALASRAGREAGAALGKEMDFRREDFVVRRAADERLFLTPSALTLDPGAFVLSNDQLLLFRAGVGVSRRVQLDLWAGGLPIPVGGAAPLFYFHAVGAAGGAALGVLGTLDLGIKVRLLDETRTRPGLAISYDFLNFFGGAIGGAGLVLLGKGVVAGTGEVGAAGANLQFNLFSVVAGKHFGDLQVTAGTYVLDNHHLIPQRAAITRSEEGTGNGGSEDNTQVHTIERFPTQVQPFLGMHYVLGPRSALATELFPRIPFNQTFGTTGVRWLLGSDAPRGPLALDRIRVRIDLAALWVYIPRSEEQGSGGLVLPVPWLGLGLYKL